MLHTGVDFRTIKSDAVLSGIKEIGEDIGTKVSGADSVSFIAFFCSVDVASAGKLAFPHPQEASIGAHVHYG